MRRRVAARLEQLNKQVGTKLLFSGAVEKILTPGRFSGIRDMGIHAVSGKNRRVTAFTMDGWLDESFNEIDPDDHLVPA